jgi:hypothetical protein
MEYQPQWLRDEVLDGFTRLVTLSLDRTPAVDVIVGTAETWMEAICHRRQWSQREDTGRVRAAFRTLAAESTSWPRPRDFLDALPARAPVEAIPSLLDESARERSRLAAEKAISEIGELLHVKQPENHPKPAPLAPLVDFPRCCEKGTREQPVCDECRAWAQETHGRPRAFQTPEEEADDFQR